MMNCTDEGILVLTNGLQHGEYYLGPPLSLVSPSPIRNIKEHLAKNVNSSEYVTMKILNFSSHNGDSAEDNQGKVLLHNEHSILSILQGTQGVIQHHGLFKESHRIILVLSCVYKHDYDQEKKYQDYINLQQYVIQKKRLSEREALRLFYMITRTVLSIHEKNIVHRDLKLGNVILNKRTQEITITNFGLSKHLVREDDTLTDQRGSLAYVSPDVLSGEPYYGKPCDVWSLGVLLYTMLYGQFPFYDDNPQELFKKIRNAKFSIPRNVEVSSETTFLLTQLIEPDPHKRMSVSEAFESTQSIFSRLSLHLQMEPMQIVPEVDTTSTSDCVVPDNDRVWSANSTNTNVNFAELSAPRLCLNPFSEQMESQSSFYFSSSPRGIHSPSSPASPRIVFFSESSQPTLVPTANPFINSSTSPHHTLPIDINSSSSSAISPSSLHSVTYTTSQSLPIYLIPTNEIDSPGTSNYSLTPDYTPPSSSLQIHLHPHQQYMSSLSRHGGAHRHSFSEGDSSSSSSLHTLLSPPQQQSHSRPMHGRRSLGSMLGATRPQRRNSHHSNTSPSYGMFSDEPPRTRRRSHEPRDNEREILQGLQAAANRTIRPTSAGAVP